MEFSGITASRTRRTGELLKLTPILVCINGSLYRDCFGLGGAVCSIECPSNFERAGI